MDICPLSPCNVHRVSASFLAVGSQHRQPAVAAVLPTCSAAAAGALGSAALAKAITLTGLLCLPITFEERTAVSLRDSSPTFLAHSLRSCISVTLCDMSFVTVISEAVTCFPCSGRPTLALSSLAPAAATAAASRTRRPSTAAQLPRSASRFASSAPPCAGCIAL